IWKATVAALVIATAGFLAFQLFPRQLLQLFNSDDALVGIGVPALRRMTLAMHFVGLFMIISATFQAVGRGLPSLVLSLLRQVIFVLPLMAYLLSHHSLEACWYAVPIADTLAAILAILWIAVSARKWNLSSERN
ncbi:MAG: MATE family efflux transporter, partial [Limnochordia bacterium]|nr:MATE family efflux transporter [Limnochordia bacterium]